MAIDRATIEHVARLARIEFGAEELEDFASQFARIVDYVDKLSELDVSADEPMAHAAHGALLREDAVGESLARKDALGGAPSVAAGFFRVPPVIDDAGSG